MPSKGRETILFVEDEGSSRAIAREILEELGYQVIEAAGADEAIESLAAILNPIQLLLTDVVMPGMNGRELAESLVAARPEIKVLYMSGYTDDIIAYSGVLESGTLLLYETLHYAGAPRARARGPRAPRHGRERISGTQVLERMRTGISGLDEALGGGLPRETTTLVVGDTGAGKTVFAIQTLVAGSFGLGEAGVFLTFEESPRTSSPTWRPSPGRLPDAQGRGCRSSTAGNAHRVPQRQLRPGRAAVRGGSSLPSSSRPGGSRSMVSTCCST